MLERQPKAGEILSYDPARIGSPGKAKRYRVAGVNSSSSNILNIVEVGTGHETTIIWRFHDGLNKCLSHESGE